jgi:hypothetical protein
LGLGVGLVGLWVFGLGVCWVGGGCGCCDGGVLILAGHPSQSEKPQLPVHICRAMEDDTAPPDIKFPCSVFDVAFHPAQDIVAVGLVSGSLQLCVLA